MQLNFNVSINPFSPIKMQAFNLLISFCTEKLTSVGDKTKERVPSEESHIESQNKGKPEVSELIYKFYWFPLQAFVSIPRKKF